MWLNALQLEGKKYENKKWASKDTIYSPEEEEFQGKTDAKQDISTNVHLASF